MEKRLPKSRMVLYCMADIAKGLFTGMIANYLLYFFQPTEASGIPNLLPQYKLFGFITVMALITAIGKIVDALSDPFVASLSDRSKNKKGRRMPFMRKSLWFYGLSVLLIYFAPFENGSVWNALWVGLFLIVYYLSYTFYFIPRNALVPEIIPSSKERVTYYGISTAFFMGSSSLMYTATLFVNLLKGAGISPLWSWRIVFLVFSIIGLVCLAVSAFAFKENDYVKERRLPKDGVLASFKVAFKNKNFVLYSAGDLFSAIAMSFFQTTMLYYITVLLKVQESLSFVVMLVAIAVALLLFPLIISLSKKIGKKPMLILSNVVFTLVYVFIYFGDKVVALVPGYELWIGIAMGVVVAFPFASINILPQAVFSDIIQEDSLLHEVNREGIFSAVKTFIEKIAIALAMMSSSSILAIGAASGQSVGLEGVKLTGIFAGGLSLIALIFLSQYNEKKVAENIAYLNQKKGEQVMKEQKETALKRKGVSIEKLEDYADTLSKMINCKTVYDEEFTNKEEFEKFYEVLKEAFPLLHQKAKRLTFGSGCFFYVLEGQEPKRNLLLMSHHDVVDGTPGWANDPFKATIKDGKLFGRGSIDTKTPLFSMLQAAEEYLEEGKPLEGYNLYIGSSNNEEVGGDGMVLASDFFKKEGIRFDVVLDEGGAIVEKMIPGYEGKSALIAVHEKSRHLYRCTARLEETGHKGLVASKESALLSLVSFIEEVNRAKIFKAKFYPEVEATFRRHVPYMRGPMKFVFKHLRLFSPVVKKIMMKMPEASPMLSTSLAFTNLHAGKEGSPQGKAKEAYATLFLRSIREEDLLEGLQKIKEIARKHKVSIEEVERDYCHPCSFDTEEFLLMESIVRDAFPDVAVAPFLLTAGTDARRLDEVAEHIFRFAPVDLSKEQFASIHGDDENIVLENVGECVNFYAECIRRFPSLS